MNYLFLSILYVFQSLSTVSFSSTFLLSSRFLLGLLFFQNLPHQFLSTLHLTHSQTQVLHAVSELLDKLWLPWSCSVQYDWIYQAVPWIKIHFLINTPPTSSGLLLHRLLYLYPLNKWRTYPVLLVLFIHLFLVPHKLKPPLYELWTVDLSFSFLILFCDLKFSIINVHFHWTVLVPF